MEQVVEHYGRFILEAFLLVALVVLLANMRDAQGNRGIFAMIGAALPEESYEYGDYGDFTAYQSESEKEKPQISYASEGLMYVGSIDFSACLAAEDYAGNALPVRIITVVGPDGGEVPAGDDGATYEAVEAGVYVVTASTVDDGARRTVSTIRIPVNSLGEGVL